MKRPKVSIIITAHNYGRYLKQSIESALGQNFDNFEVIVVDDGSTDNTGHILKRYKNKAKIVKLAGAGLARAANIGIRASSGEYVVRLDADDYFDENLLLVESDILDRRPDIDMVYPDYYTIDADGEIIEHIRLLKFDDAAKLLDRNCLAAGAMYRRRAYDAIGGYNKRLKYREDYDFWLRFTKKFKVYNVNIPLMYYRQHRESMSKNIEPRLQAHRKVKEDFVERYKKVGDKKILCIIPAEAGSRIGWQIPLRQLNKRPLIAYTIEEALKVKPLNKIIVSTEDKEIAKVAKDCGADVLMRHKVLTGTSVSAQDVSKVMIKQLQKKKFYPDVVVFLQVLFPFRKAHHITEAINTFLMHNVDSVISVVEDLTFHWQLGEYGLKEVIYHKRLLRQEKEKTYKENGAIYVVKTENLFFDNMLGERVGYIEMQPYEAVRLESGYDFWVAEQMLLSGKYR